MPEDMSSSRRYLISAGTRISTLKGYISGRNSPSGSRTLAPNANGTSSREERQGWRAWAGQKIRVRGKGMYGSANENTELVNVFPGWAVRRYPAGTHGGIDAPKPFELEAFVSGYAISYRPPENASRSQRAFIRMAKGFASLPKLVEKATDVLPNSSSFAALTPSTEELLATVKLPPRPEEITDDYDVDTLERQLRRAKDASDDDSGSTSGSSSGSVSSRPATPDFHPPLTNTAQHVTRPHPSERDLSTPTPAEVIRRLHANLEKRLQPFWSSVLPNRVIRLHLFATPHLDQVSSNMAKSRPNAETEDVDILLDSENGPLASQDVYTAADGSFEVKFKVKWEDLCLHPMALHIAFGEALEEHDLLIVAQLLPPGNVSQQSLHVPSSTAQPVPLSCFTRIPITNSPIRVVSDIDDTIKFSGILSGARALFHNVFVKELKDSIIPGMGEWYSSMWSRGVRFHYVSNGPFELLPMLNEFFEVSQLPPGSIKLRSYTGRSLFNGLLSAPAARKRTGVLDVLQSFPESRFILIGDTGEQDLELYADLARERPSQILGVFVRDADITSFEPLDDPTGWRAMGDAGTRSSNRPLVPRSDTGVSSRSSASNSSVSTSLSQYNYGDTPKTVRVSADRTPRTDRHIFSDVDSSTFTSEPESMATPTLLSSGRMESSETISQARHNSISSLTSRVKIVDKPPKPTPPPSISANLSYRSQQTDSSASSFDSSSAKKLSDAEKRRADLQLRVYRARTQMPGHVFLRVFRSPSECIEAQELLDHEKWDDEPMNPPNPLFWTR